MSNTLLKVSLHNHYIKDGFILLTGNGLKIVAGFFVNILLAKFLSPEEYATYGTLMTISLLSVNITDFGFGNTLNKAVKDNPSKTKSIFTGLFLVKLFLLILFAILYSRYSRTISEKMISLTDNNYLLKWLILLIIIESIFRFLLAQLQSKHKFKKYSTLLFINNVLRLVGVLCLYSFSVLTLKNVIFLYAISFLVLFFTNWDFDFISAENSINIIFKYLPYAFWAWLFIIFNNLFVKSDVIIPNLLRYNKTIIGSYVLIVTFVSLINILQMSVFTQLLPKTNTFKTKEDFQKYYKDIKYVRVSFVILATIYIFILPFILDIIYSKSYIINKMIVFLFGIPFIFSIYNEFNSVLLYAINRHFFITLANIIGMVVVVIMFFINIDLKTISHIVLSYSVGKLCVDTILYVKVKQLLRTL